MRATPHFVSVAHYGSDAMPFYHSIGDTSYLFVVRRPHACIGTGLSVLHVRSGKCVARIPPDACPTCTKHWVIAAQVAVDAAAYHTGKGALCAALDAAPDATITGI